jgi:hypothetical protein
MSRTTGCVLAAFVWVAIAATPSTVAAQEPEEAGDLVLEQLRQDVVLAAPDAADVDTTIEQWIFGGQSAGRVRKRLEAALVQDIKRFDQKYVLTPIQKKKLELAGGYDIKRYFDRVEEAKAEYRRVKGDWNQMGGRISELQRAQNQVYRELFGDESMLAKTLKKNLTSEQVARHDKAVYRQRVEWMAALLHNRLNLNSDQRRGFVTLIMEETPPLKRYGSFDYDAIMFQLSRLPRERLRTVLDEGQCRELTLRFEQARRMESILVSEGYLSPAKTRAGAAAKEASGSAAREGEKAALTKADRAGGGSP